MADSALRRILRTVTGSPRPDAVAGWSALQRDAAASFASISSQDDERTTFALVFGVCFGVRVARARPGEVGDLLHAATGSRSVGQPSTEEQRWVRLCVDRFAQSGDQEAAAVAALGVLKGEPAVEAMAALESVSPDACVHGLRLPSPLLPWADSHG